jgi:trimeric autotransporter adhesin
MLLQACRQPARLLFLLILLSAIAIAATPGVTTISDTVYRADGLPASGTVLISWPAFNTAANQAVAAGTLSVNLGSQGALTLDLVPNAGSTPAGTLYRVVYKLDDGTVDCLNASLWAKKK